MKLTTEDVWAAIDGANFGVLAFVNAAGEPRTAGIVYITDDQTLLVSTKKDSWKVRHMRANPNVSMTVTLPKRVMFMPFIKVPAATITFNGVAEVLDVAEVGDVIANRLMRGLQLDPEVTAQIAIVRVVPYGEFITYGIGMPLMRMRKPELAQDRVPVSEVAKAA